jgi:biopolymer transport protein ExbB/TolQ
MRKFLNILRGTREVLVTVGAVLAAAIIAVETYEALRKKIDTTRNS